MAVVGQVWVDLRSRSELQELVVFHFSLDIYAYSHMMGMKNMFLIFLESSSNFHVACRVDTIHIVKQVGRMLL